MTSFYKKLKDKYKGATGGKKADVTQAEGISAPFQPVTDPTQLVKKLSFKTADLVPKLNSPKLKRLKLEGSLYIEVTAELTGEAYKQNEKNDLFEVDVKSMANGWFGPAIDQLVANMAKVLEDVDETKIPQAQVQTAFEKNCAGESQRLSIKLQGKIAEYIESNKAIKSAYRTYQVKVVHNIAMSVAVIVVSAVSTGVSWGATGPVAVVAIVRSTVGLGIEIANSCLSAGQVMEVIEGYFKVLGELMETIDTSNDTLQKQKAKIAKNTAKEGALGAIAGVLNIELPSVQAVEGKMELLENKLKGLHTDRLKFGEKLSETRREIDAYKKKIDENSKSPDFDAVRLKKHLGYVAEFSEQYKKLFEKTEHLLNKIREALVRQTEFTTQLNLYKESQKSFARKSKAVFGFATSVGLGVGSGSSSAEYCLGALNEVLGVIEGKVWDKV